MARSVQITTPIPTLKEFGKSLGLSKRRQDSLIRLVRGDKTSIGLTRAIGKSGGERGIVADVMVSSPNRNVA